jgi:hypothetical protein
MSLASVADAATYDFSGRGGLDTSYSFTADGIGLTVTAGTFTTRNGGTVRDGALVGQYGGGLGVTSHTGDSRQVDGMNRNDILIFDFDQDVELESVTFTRVDRNDEFRFFFEDASDDLIDWGGQIDIPGRRLGTYAFALEWVGDQFGIGALDSYDNFFVRGITANAVSAVPLPGTLALLLSGMALLGAAGVRRKAQLAA